MAIANRWRNNTNVTNPSSIFEQDQSLGELLRDCARSIVDRQNTVKLTSAGGTVLRLETMSDWNGFIANFFRSTALGETDRARAEILGATLGVDFTNVIRFIEDVFSTEVTNEEFDATRNSQLAQLVRLYDGPDSYVQGIAEGASAPASGRPGSDIVRVQAESAIGPDIMAGGQQPAEGRDRQEVEGQIDFTFSAGSDQIFRDTAGNDIWRGLNLLNLAGNFWNDQARMNLIHAYNMPLHLEVDPNDVTGYQLNTSDFLEVYLDTDQRTLAANALSIRVRVRPDQNNRALLQMKEELPANPITGRPVREKWERRDWGAAGLDLDGLMRVAQTGYFEGQVVPSMQKLYQKLRNKGALPDGMLRLRPDHVIFQRRTRSHLRLEAVSSVGQRLAFLQQVAAAQNPVAPSLAAFLSKVRTQLQLMQAAEGAMLRTIGRGLPSGFDAVIISFDRWSTFEPSAYAPNDWPESLGDRGRRGRGLRVETELDAFTSEPFEDAIEIIDAQLSGSPPNRVQLAADRAAIAFVQNALFEDVTTTARLMARRMEDAGLDRIVSPFPSKSDAAMAMFADGQSGFRHGHRFWV
jgi:hypothetical protein